MIEQDDIKLVLDTAKIEDVVSDYVVLTKRGVNYTGLCPFHDEKTSSFTVSPVKGIYKCFGCGKAGNSVSFIMEHEKFTFPEAIRYLADKCKITLTETHDFKKEEKKEDQSLFNSLILASNLFQSNLKEDNNALQYLYSRGYNDEIIEKFKLGYSKNSYNQLSDLSISKGFQNYVMNNSGLCILKDGVLSDRFRDRIMFPIFNLSNKIIAFGGRVLTTEKTRSKYVNSPETELYNKSKVLYGLNFAKKEIIKQDRCFLVEGYTDVITLHQVGIENVVASSGTSLTADQIKLICRYTKNITILYDGDLAGIKASFRGIDMILSQGMNVSVVLFPNGEDPDSFAKSHKDTIKEYIANNTKNFISFKTEVLLEDTNNDPIKLSELTESICETIALIPDSISINFYTNECATIMNIKKSILATRIEEIRSVKSGKKRNYPTKKLSSSSNYERDIIRILINSGNETVKIKARKDDEIVFVEIPIAQIIISDICMDDFTFENEIYDTIFNEYKSFVEKNELVPDNYFTNHTNNEICIAAADMIELSVEISDSWSSNDILYKNNETDFLLKSTQKALLYFKLKKIDKIIASIDNDIKQSTDDDITISLLGKRDQFLKIKKEMNKMIISGKFNIF